MDTLNIEKMRQQDQETRKALQEKTAFPKVEPNGAFETFFTILAENPATDLQTLKEAKTVLESKGEEARLRAEVKELAAALMDDMRPSNVKVRAASDIKARPQLPPDLVKDVISSKGLCMLAGASKIGKTLIASELAAAIAEGRDWMGIATRSTKTWFINMEVLPEYFEARLWDTSGGKLPENLFLTTFTGEGYSEARLLSRIEEEIKKHGFGLAVLDCFYKIFEGDETKGQELKIFQKKLERLQKKTGCKIILVHHQKKSGDSKGEKLGFTDPFTNYSGSGMMGRDLTEIISMDRLVNSSNEVVQLEPITDDENADPPKTIIKITVGNRNQGTRYIYGYMDHIHFKRLSYDNVKILVELSEEKKRATKAEKFLEKRDVIFKAYKALTSWEEHLDGVGVKQSTFASHLGWNPANFNRDFKPFEKFFKKTGGDGRGKMAWWKLLPEFAEDLYKEAENFPDLP